MAFVVARKEPVPAGKPRVWIYWTGKEWSADVAAAERHPSREAAIAVHAQLLKAQAWPAGGNPLVVERN